MSLIFQIKKYILTKVLVGETITRKTVRPDDRDLLKLNFGTKSVSIVLLYVETNNNFISCTWTTW